MSGIDPLRARLLLRRARIALYAAVVLVLGYHLWRYDLVGLPEQGCSPLLAFSPGTHLIVDRHPRAPEPGEAVLYRGPTGLLLGRVEEPPPSAPREVWEACAAGALWIVKERAECPGEDSRLLGPVAKDAVEGVVRGALPW